jgi:hypothetical protein
VYNVDKIVDNCGLCGKPNEKAVHQEVNCA